jgi:hypothetical protein
MSGKGRLILPERRIKFKGVFQTTLTGGIEVYVILPASGRSGEN